MHNDLASLTGRRTVPLVVGGETYQVHPLSLDDLGQLQAWVDAQFDDPIEVASAALGRGLTRAQEQHLLSEALKLACQPRAKIGTPEGDALLRSVDGIKQLLVLAIRKGRPNFTLEQASAIFEALSAEQIALAMSGSGLETAMEGPESPKPGGTATSPTATADGSTGGGSITRP